MLAVTILVIYYVVRWIRHSLGKLGLSHGEVAVIVWGTFIGAFINFPLFAFPSGEGVLAINVGGGVIPVVLSLYLIKRKGLALNEVLVGVPAVAFVTYLVTDYVPGMGVISPFPYWLLPAFVAFVIAGMAYWNERENSASLAYVVGTLGVLIGADLVRIPEILAGPPPGEGAVLSIGGAAVFDMVYLTGLIAITMETGLLAKLRHDLSRGDRRNPIEAEYQAWVEKKRREWSDIETERRREDARRSSVRRDAEPGRERVSGRPSEVRGQASGPGRAGRGGGSGPRPAEWTQVQRSGGR